MDGSTEHFSIVRLADDEPNATVKPFHHGVSRWRDPIVLEGPIAGFSQLTQYTTKPRHSEDRCLRSLAIWARLKNKPIFVQGSFKKFLAQLGAKVALRSLVTPHRSSLACSAPTRTVTLFQSEYASPESSPRKLSHTTKTSVVFDLHSAMKVAGFPERDVPVLAARDYVTVCVSSIGLVTVRTRHPPGSVLLLCEATGLSSPVV